MCCRYFREDDLPEQMRNAFPDLSMDPAMFTAGDYYPSERAAILTGKPVRSSVMRWGLISPIGGSPIINARQETVLEKKSFQSHFMNRRCLIPVSGFYEWDPHKEKVNLRRKDGKLLLLGGFWQLPKAGEEPRYVIMTTEANETMRSIHPRMPVFVEPENAQAFLTDLLAAEELIGRIMPEVVGEKDREQLSLF